MVQIVKKRTKRFIRHHKSTLNKSKGNNFIRMRTGWRKPRGIDSAVRRKFKSLTLMPKIGYGSNKATRHMLPNKQRKFTAKQMSDLDMLVMHNEKYCVEIAAKIGAKLRKEMVARADSHGLRVVNRHARVATEEQD